MALLPDKIAVITGGNRGIGPATAKRFVNEDVHVFITEHRQAELESTCQWMAAQLPDNPRLENPYEVRHYRFR
jgi:NAD(P)-dependent dehydrogenase (short-subunit alcohol dehydrogenase family)